MAPRSQMMICEGILNAAPHCLISCLSFQEGYGGSAENDGQNDPYNTLDLTPDVCRSLVFAAPFALCFADWADHVYQFFLLRFCATLFSFRSSNFWGFFWKQKPRAPRSWTVLLQIAAHLSMRYSIQQTKKRVTQTNKQSQTNNVEHNQPWQQTMSREYLITTTSYSNNINQLTRYPLNPASPPPPFFFCCASYICLAALS